MTRNEPDRCLEFSILLADALEGEPAEATLDALAAHAAVCDDCQLLQERAREGRNWLGTLDDVAPPAQLVHNILAATSLATAVAPGERPRTWAATLWAPLLRLALQPRLVMTAAMAFFSLSLLANTTGVSMDDLRASDLRALRPSRIGARVSLQYHAAAASLVRYYENNRLVNELEAQLRDLRANAVAEPDAQPEPATGRPGGRSGMEQETHVNG